MQRGAEAIYEQEPPERARALLLARAELGDAEAQFFLGHLADEETPRRPDVALAWYRKSAAGGYGEAKHWVASFLYHGMGTAQDVPAALALFREGAAAGDAASQWKLAEHLLQFPESRVEALVWLERSAAQGHPVACDLLSQERRRGT